MAEIVKKVTRTVKKTANKVSKKATEIADVTKYSIKVKSKLADINEAFERLGGLYYAYTQSLTDEAKAELDGCVLEINTLKLELAQLKAQLARAKGEVRCKGCGEYVSASKENCPKCKATLERIETSENKGL
ncbi:MAG: hypothetical protein J6A54_06720 [Clostridia bacterium]|nr:hypothetical protein [Clostridia bacterium]